MDGQTATTVLQERPAAMTPEQEAIERNFGVPPVGVEKEKATTPEAQKVSGQPQVAPKPEEELEEKYRGKTAAEIARMHREAEKAMHEATEAKAKTAKELEAREAQIRSLTAEQEQRARYERMLQERHQPQADPAKEKFKKVVNENEDVLGAVEDVSAGAARRALQPEIQSLNNQIEFLKAQHYQIGLNNLMAADQELAKLWPEIQQQAVDVGSRMAKMMYAGGATEDQVVRALQEFNRDLDIVPVLKTMVVGRKGPEYFASTNQQTTKREEDTAKAHLGGGGGAPSAGESGEMPISDFQKLSTAEQRAYLKKKGAL